MPKKGFTLTEILIVLVIIGIVATLGLPIYTRTRERTIGKEARANLKLIAAAQRIYRMEYLMYYKHPAAPLAFSPLADVNQGLKIYLAGQNWNYTVDANNGAPQTFNLTATRNTTQAPFNACTYTLPNNDADGEPNTVNTNACPD